MSKPFYLTPFPLSTRVERGRTRPTLAFNSVGVRLALAFDLISPRKASCSKPRAERGEVG